MSENIIIIAEIEAKEDQVDFVKSELEKLIEPTRKEDGCLQYDLHRDNNSPNKFLFYEKWENKAMLEKHMGSKALQEYMKATKDALLGFTIKEMSKLS